jgi:hypothetical protein
VRCEAKNKSGKPCGGFAIHGSKRCCMHTAGNAQRFGTKGGHRRALFDKDALEPVAIPKDARELLSLTMRTLIEVRGQKVDTKVANCLFYGVGAALNCLQHSDLEERMAAMEARYEATKGEGA